jgi:hypothetical protein
MAHYVFAVPPELLIKTNDQIIADREIYGSADVVQSAISVFAREHQVEELLAVSHRLMALARLISSGQIDQWTKNIKDWRLLSKALFQAAARAPLRESELLRDMTFDPEEFLEIALRVAESSGSA